MNGVRIVWREEQNMRIELAMGLLAIILGVVLGFSTIELSIVILLIGSILAAECANSALERIVDILKPRVSEYVRVVKDIVAAMMLVLVITSLFVAFLLYLPKILNTLPIVIQAIFY